ncbi:MAG TPA: hypothetical protein VF291_05825, partial [Burkholderiaceae bacterium]
MDTRRLVLLFIFGFSVLMLWDAWEKEHRPKPAAQAFVPAVPAAPAAAPGSAAPPSAAAAAAAIAGSAPSPPMPVPLSATTTLAPSRTNASAMARPMPR